MHWTSVAVMIVLAGVFTLCLSSRKRRKPPITVGFLHPHCLTGGGGERVLWCALLAVQNAMPGAQIVVYSAWSEAGVPLEEAVGKTKSALQTQFGLSLGDCSFIPVDICMARLVDPSRYPRLTLLFQAVGTTLLGLHAYWKHPVDVFVDTANLTFGLVFPKLLGAQTMSYVHYPTISTDMLSVVRSRRAQFNNSEAIARSTALSFVKLLYYRMFAFLYAVAALFCDIPLANSSWTRNHLESLWWRPQRLKTVFPPCPSIPDAVIVDSSARDEGLIVSVGQFRPEKNHELQLDIMEYLQNNHPTLKAKLLMIGGTRNIADEQRGQALRKSASRRHLPVTVLPNASCEELVEALNRASVGLHTMRDEHFGISVVELQAHGLIAVGHNSGGVRLDIIEDGVTGLLAGEGGAAEYGERIADAMHGMSAAEQLRMRERGVRAARRFSEAAFQEQFAFALGEVCLAGRTVSLLFPALGGRRVQME